jgi:C4-dicarboxylate transporter DctM subunit
VSAILIFSAIMLALVLIGSPLLTIMGGATLLLFAIFMPEYRDVENLLIVIQKSEDLFTKQEFLAIPLFTISGAIMTAGGIAKRLISVAEAAFGWLPGGMAVAAIVACMLFGSITGSSPVTLIAIGSIMFPALVRAGYPENFALGLLTTAGSLGCLVPPSQAMLFYSLSTTGSPAAVAPEDMFLGGMLPATFMAGLLMVYAVFKGLKVKEERPAFTVRALLQAIRNGIWALLLPGVVLGGIYGGFFTPSEAGGPAGVYAIVVTMVIYRELTFDGLKKALVDTAGLMGSLLPIIALSFGLNEFIALAEVKDSLEGWLIAKQFGPFEFLFMVNIFLIVIGALMDSISCTLIFAPMLAPIAWKLYGIDPVHFGVVFVVNMEIGYLMPPVATNLFVSAAVFRKPFGQVTRAVLPTLGLTCIGLFVLMYVPTLSKAALNWKNGVAMYEAFPWNGRPADPTDPTDAPTEVAAPVSAAPLAPVSAPASEGAALDISDLTAKSMEGFDDEPASAPASGAASAPSAPAADPGKALDLNDLTQKAMDGFDDEAPASQAPAAP